MATTIKMPQLGESVTEGTIERWLVKEGDTVEQYDPLFEVVTDKVNAEVPAEIAGTITKIMVPDGETVAVGTPLAEIDAEGGAAQAIERGFFQDAIARSAYQLQKEQESGERVVVGVNRFSDDSPPLTIQTPDFSALEQQQRSSLTEVRSRRDGKKVRATLNALHQAAAGTDRLMPVIIEAVKARATLGEISDTLRSVWGVYRPA